MLWEAVALLAASAALLVWYSVPQILYSLYPMYELLRLAFPDVLPEILG